MPSSKSTHTHSNTSHSSSRSSTTHPSPSIQPQSSPTNLTLKSDPRIDQLVAQIGTLTTTVNILAAQIDALQSVIFTLRDKTITDLNETHKRFEECLFSLAKK
eukprot:Phypoly_transcript_25685.p1 GENE.Phypoly_transcript_25685~~Phypoly_transcript_25685.p1  ORF type:complete len:103 (+),score=20.20 Phypoly_transcript_25685:166-474(+)